MRSVSSRISQQEKGRENARSNAPLPILTLLTLLSTSSAFSFIPGVSTPGVPLSLVAVDEGAVVEPLAYLARISARFRRRSAIKVSGSGGGASSSSSRRGAVVVVGVGGAGAGETEV